jgi:hypothetical protein
VISSQSLPKWKGKLVRRDWARPWVIVDWTQSDKNVDLFSSSPALQFSTRISPS